MSEWIIGIGTALPPHAITQADAAEIAKHYASSDESRQRRFVTLYNWSGVESRHGVVLRASDGPLDERQAFYVLGSPAPSTSDRMRLYEAEVTPLAVAAARAALVDAQAQAHEVTHLVTVSCTGFFAPGLDCALIGQLGLSPDVERTHVGFMGCHGALNGLRVAHAILRAFPTATVLLCTAELCSLHHQYGWSPEQIVANALFADGAGALLAVAGPRPQRPRYRLLASGSTVVAGTEDAMSWRIGDHGFTMGLSPKVPELIERHLPGWIVGWLGMHGLRIEEIASWAVHPGGPRILTAVRDALGLSRTALDVSHDVLTRHGNMSSPTVLFILDRLDRDRPEGPCVALAFGPGLTIEAGLLA